MKWIILNQLKLKGHLSESLDTIKEQVDEVLDPIFIIDKTTI